MSSTRVNPPPRSSGSHVHHTPVWLQRKKCKSVGVDLARTSKGLLAFLWPFCLITLEGKSFWREGLKMEHPPFSSRHLEKIHKHKSHKWTLAFKNALIERALSPKGSNVSQDSGIVYSDAKKRRKQTYKHPPPPRPRICFSNNDNKPQRESQNSCFYQSRGPRAVRSSLFREQIADLEKKNSGRHMKTLKYKNGSYQLSPAVF